MSSESQPMKLQESVRYVMISVVLVPSVSNLILKFQIQNWCDVERKINGEEYIEESYVKQIFLLHCYFLIQYLG